MDIFDLSLYRELQQKTNTTTKITAEFRLDKITMIKLLNSKKIMFNGNYYKVPEDRIIFLLFNRIYGNTELSLELLT